MGRPPFVLTDDQGRILTKRVNELELSCPLSGKSHRPFVRGFILAVHEATGQFFSPTIYRRLLSGYAPKRRPSTVTLADEKERLIYEMSRLATATPPPGAPATHVSAGIDPYALKAHITEAVEHGINRANHGQRTDSAESHFLRNRLQEAEQQLANLRATAAALASELEVAKQSARQHAEEAARATSALAGQANSVDSLTAELAEMRKFTMMSIDGARGETRMWKERYAGLEAQRQSDGQLLETFRRLAYQKGAEIPAQLTKDRLR